MAQDWSNQPMMVVDGRHEIAVENDGCCAKCGCYWVNGKDSFLDGCPTCQPDDYIRMTLDEWMCNYGKVV